MSVSYVPMEDYNHEAVIVHDVFRRLSSDNRSKVVLEDGRANCSAKRSLLSQEERNSKTNSND